MECRRCPWWPTCEAELEREDDVSLVVRGDAATALRAAGASPPSRGSPRSTPPSSRRSRSPRVGARVPGPCVALARAWLARPGGGAPGAVGARRCGRTSRWTSTWRASASPARTCGARCSPGAATPPGDEPEGYRAFATWEPVPTPDEARSFAAFWTWLTGVRARAPRPRAGRSPRTATTSRRRTAGCSRRPGGSPACRGPRRRRSRSSSPTTAGSTCSPWSASGSSARTARGSSGSPPRPVSPGATPRRAGRTPCAGTATRSGWTAPSRTAQRLRLLEYNADDVAATRALREWMTSRVVEEVPLAVDL